MTALPSIVFFAYAVLTPEKAQLFLSPAQINDALRKHLGDHVDIHPYDSFFSYLGDLGAEIGLHKKSVWHSRSGSCFDGL